MLPEHHAILDHESALYKVSLVVVELPWLISLVVVELPWLFLWPSESIHSMLLTATSTLHSPGPFTVQLGAPPVRCSAR